MAEKSEQTNDTSSSDESKDFQDLSLDDMETTLRSEAENVDEEETKSDDSEASEEVSEDSEETSTDDKEENTDSSGKAEDKQEESLEARFARLEKQNKELQAEFTRRSQKLKELESELNKQEVVQGKKEQVSDKESKLADLRKKNPEAADLLQNLIEEEVNKRLEKDIRPLEERMVLRTRQENIDAWAKKSDEFIKSDLKELESEIITVYNENPSEWQRLIFENPNAFDEMKKEVVFRNLDKIIAIKAKEVSKSPLSKKRDIENAKVTTKSKVTSKTPELLSKKEFKSLSLDEMEKRLPKAE